MTTNKHRQGLPLLGLKQVYNTLVDHDGLLLCRAAWLIHALQPENVQSRCSHLFHLQCRPSTLSTIVSQGPGYDLYHLKVYALIFLN